jgi:hypothetical protein
MIIYLSKDCIVGVESGMHDSLHECIEGDWCECKCHCSGIVTPRRNDDGVNL